ncbi:ChaN family lipoprotein [Stutzerimonas azotifigens]|uniref:ChaN family lipoprotein n=1 Tax=Stutzerimonas azotifigens TaxID=291995 RepID=UPI00041C6692|nr:ChaN family lipoprotein [Stutzerimonas azotifigens]
MRIWLLLPLILLAACSRMPVAPEPISEPASGRIVELSTGRHLSPTELVERLGRRERVLIGERHDNPAHHRIERWLLQAVDRRAEAPALLLEMLDPGQQPRVDAVRQALRDGRPVDDLPAALGWQPGWDWGLYGELLAQAVARPAPLLSANLTREDIRRIYRSAPRLPAGRSTDEAVQAQLAEHIRAAHCDLLPAEQLPAMLAVQQQRDRRMAERLLAASAPAWLMAGAYHVRRDLGVPLHLADLGGAEQAAVLVLAEEGEAVEAGQADYVWFTPAQPQVDHCAALRDEQAKKDPAEPGQKP